MPPKDKRGPGRPRIGRKPMTNAERLARSRAMRAERVAAAEAEHDAALAEEDRLWKRLGKHIEEPAEIRVLLAELKGARQMVAATREKVRAARGD